MCSRFEAVAACISGAGALHVGHHIELAQAGSRASTGSATIQDAVACRWGSYWKSRHWVMLHA